MCLIITLILELVGKETSRFGLKCSFDDWGRVDHSVQRGLGGMVDLGGCGEGWDDQVVASRRAAVDTVGEVGLAEF